MVRNPRVLVLAVSLAVSAFAPAQKNAERIVLSSGEVHEARRSTTEEGVLLTTALGHLTVKPADIAAAEDAAVARKAFAAEVEGLHPANVRGQAAAAKSAAKQGLWTAVRTHANLALEVDPEDAETRTLLAQLAKTFRQNDFEGQDGHRRQKAVDDWLEQSGKDATAAVLAVEKARGTPASLLLRPALKALKSREPWSRYAAARLLTDLRFEPERIKPLYRMSLVDRDARVRKAAVQALKATNDPVFVGLYARNLSRSEQSIRMTAGEALGELGMKEALEPLVQAAAGDGSRPPHSYISVTNQRAYVKDFDVEVAQGAVIADPIVDVVQDGTVLDVAVVQITIERHVYYTSLRRLTGLKHADDPKLWRTALAVKK